MSDSTRDRMELLGLAHRRYPDVEPWIAVEFFLSDRRRAGLGALDARRRLSVARKEISYYKQMDFYTGRIEYDARLNVPARREYPKLQESLADFFNDNSALACVQLIERPAVMAHLRLPFERSIFDSQTGRRFVAKELRKLRLQLRKDSGNAG